MEEDGMSDVWRSRTFMVYMTVASLLLLLFSQPYLREEGLADGEPTGSSGPLIGRLSPAPGEGNSEFVAVCPGDGDWDTGEDVDGWTLTAGHGKGDDDWMVIPRSDGTIPHAERDDCVYLAEKAEQFMASMGFLPALEAEDTRPDVPQVTLPTGGHWPRLANDGAVVRLLDAGGTEKDRVVYGENSSGPGWTGVPVTVPRSAEILTRESTGSDGKLSFPDTDTATEWEHLRRYYPRQSVFTAGWAMAEGATFIPLPDASLNAAGLIDSAESTVDVNVYKFTSWPMAERLLGAMDRGVHVRILVEGAPVGGMNVSEAYILEELEKAGADVRVMKGDTANGIHRRYSMDHSKYMVIDGSTLLVGSENWVSSGLSGSTTYGNRGWAMSIDMTAGSCDMCGLFEQDISFDEPDVQRWADARAGITIPPEFPGQKETRDGHHVPVFGPYETQGVGGTSYRLVISPDTSLSSLVGLMDGASEKVQVEMFSMDLYWENRTGNEVVSPLVDAVLDAARRGVSVKILLDKSFVFATNGTEEEGIGDGNDVVLTYLEGKAGTEGLDLEVRWADIDGIELLHNKAVVVDDQVLVSSINWVRSSVLSNREVGVIVKDRPMSDKASEVFMSDWVTGVTGGSGGGGEGNNTTGEEDEKEQIPFPGGPVVIIAIAIATVLLDGGWRGRRGLWIGGGSSGI